MIAKRIGRPPIAPELRASVQILIRCTEDEKAALVAAAERAGESLSAWARERVLRAARR